MSHEISFNTIGQAEAVFGFNVAPWWNNKDMPAVVLPSAVSFDKIFEIAFPWHAEMEQLQYQDGSLSSQHGIRRSDTKAELGVHSGNYGAIQPKDLFDFCAAFFQQYPEIPIASAIAMQGGAVLNLSAKLGEINILNSGDIHQSYLCFVNSFNGKIKAQAYKSYVRPVCMNTTISGISNADFKMEYKHTKNVRERIKDDINKATALMQAQQATDENVKNTLETLAKRKLNKQTYTEILDSLFPNESKKTENNKKLILELYGDNDNNAFPDFKGTAYNLYNSITNYIDHEKSTKGNNKEQNRFESSQIGLGAAFKMKAMERILVMSDGSEVNESFFDMKGEKDYRIARNEETSNTNDNPNVPMRDREVIVSKDDYIPLDTHKEKLLLDSLEKTINNSKEVLPEIKIEQISLFTSAPKSLDSSIVIESNANVARIDNKVYREVLCPIAAIRYQTDIYKKQSFDVFTESEWNHMQ